MINVKSINHDIFEVSKNNTIIGHVCYNHDTGKYDGYSENNCFEKIGNRKEAIKILIAANK